jgi:hypothetical protein
MGWHSGAGRQFFVNRGNQAELPEVSRAIHEAILPSREELSSLCRQLQGLLNQSRAGESHPGALSELDVNRLMNTLTLVLRSLHRADVVGRMDRTAVQAVIKAVVDLIGSKGRTLMFGMAFLSSDFAFAFG